MKKRVFAAGLAGALFSLCAAAEDLLAVYQQALQNDAQLEAAAAARDAARELKPQALSFVLPNIQGSAETAKNTLRTDAAAGAFPPSGRAEFNSNFWQIKAVQPLFNWQLIAGLGQADALVRQADNQYAFAEQELMLRTSGRYFGVLSAADNLRFVESEKAAIGRQLEQAKQRFEVGLIAITDIHEAQARYDLTVAQEIEARNQLTNAMEALREVTGSGYEALTPLAESLPLVLPDGDDSESWVTQALNQNPLVAAAGEAATAAKKEVERQRAGHFPTLDATATYLSSSANASRFGAGNDGEDTIYGLEMKLPLFEGGRTRSQVRQAQQQYRQARQRLEQQRRATARETRDAYIGVEAAISRVRAFTQAQLSSESALEATELGYQVGTRTSVDMLDAERELYRAKRNLATARYDYVLNVLRLEQASGQLSEEDLARVNGWLAEAAASTAPPPVAP